MRSGFFGRDWPACVLLTLVCLALYLPGLSTIPPVDRDEPRFAQATKQMLETHDFIRPRFQTENRFKKPIGIYWLQAAAVLATRQQGRRAIWPYRLPSVLGALAAVLLTYWIGCQLFNRPVALLGAALLASSALLVVEAHVATTDATLLACMIAAQGCLASLYSAAHRGSPSLTLHAAGFWLAQGLGILVKGPIVPLVSGLTVGTLLVVDRRAVMRMLAGLRAAWGVPLMLLLILPWAVAVGLATDGVFYRDWFGGDVLPKILSGQESHGAPPGFYVVLLAVTFWPGSFAMGLGIAHGFRHRQSYAERFCLAWLIPTWLFFELMPTKLPHYLLPTYPALALLAACAVFAPRASHSLAWATGVVRTGFVLWGALTLALSAVIVAASVLIGGGLDVFAAGAALAAAAIAIVCVRLAWTGQLVRASWAAVVGSVALYAPLLQRVIPELHPLWLSPAASAAIAQRTPRASDARPVVAVGYEEPSLIFLTGADIALVEPTRAVTFLSEHSDGLALVSDDRQAAFMQAASEMGVRVRELWSVDGINYSKGHRTQLHLFEPLRSADASP